MGARGDRASRTRRACARRRSAACVVRLRPERQTNYDLSWAIYRNPYDRNFGNACDVNPAFNSDVFGLDLHETTPAAFKKTLG